MRGEGSVMFDSPLSASAYEVLGVPPTADDEELRRTYRLRLRQTHPDTGGDAAVFIQVQQAWELIGSRESRTAYDRGHGFVDGARWDGWQGPAATGTRPRATAFGTAGAWRRDRYLALVTQWAGRPLDDPYDPAFVRSVPRDLRRLLAEALAEEHTAQTIASLGMGFTAWHDVAAGDDAEHKIDHLVLTPRGLYGVMSEDFGAVVGFRGGEIVGPSLGLYAPVTTALSRIRHIAKPARVRFSGALIVLPDDDLAQPVTPLGNRRDLAVLVVQRSTLSTVLRSGIPGARPIGGNELFDIRTRLQQTVRFV